MKKFDLERILNTIDSKYGTPVAVFCFIVWILGIVAGLLLIVFIPLALFIFDPSMGVALLVVAMGLGGWLMYKTHREMQE
jgi:hypothetical protein